MEVPDSQVPTLRKGSIYAFIAWLSYIFMAWSFKGVLMFLYTQLTYVSLLWTCECRSLETEWAYGNIALLLPSASSASLLFWPLFSSISLAATQSIGAGKSSHMQEVSIPMATTHGAILTVLNR